MNGSGLDMNEDLGSPNIEELFYSDRMSDRQSEIVSQVNWLNKAFGDSICKSTPKTYLLKLVEYNKAEIVENDKFIQQKTEIEVALCKFMKQKLMNDEIKYMIDSYGF